MIRRLSKRVLGICVCAALIMVAGTALGAAVHGQYKGYNIVKLLVDGREITPDVPAIIMDDRTLLPARYLAQALGATVTFDPATYVVDVRSKDSASTREGFYVTDKDIGVMVASPTLRKDAHSAIAANGSRFLQVMVIVKNFGQQDVWVSPETFSVMVGANKYNYATCTMSDANKLAGQVVKAGTYATGIVIFEVPDNATYDLVPGQMLYSTTLVKVPVLPSRI